MLILAVDTSGPVAGCALMRDGEIIYNCAMKLGNTHSETIMPAIDTMLETCGLKCADVDLFAAVAGPGSFTGVRIGVCAVKGMAHAVKKPCVAVHALKTLALNMAVFEGIVCPILDARRGQVYCAAFDVSSGMPARVIDDDAIFIDDFIAKLPNDKNLAFVGDGVRVNEKHIKEMLGARAIIPPSSALNLRADAACVLAERDFENAKPALELTPIYLRAPSAERERMARLK